jgi:hypothetical protein
MVKFYMCNYEQILKMVQSFKCEVIFCDLGSYWLRIESNFPFQIVASLS